MGVQFSLIMMDFMYFQGDYAALLSAFAEIGLKLRMDMPEDAMQVTNFFFRRSIPGKESPVSRITLSGAIGIAYEFQKSLLFFQIFTSCDILLCLLTAGVIESGSHLSL